MNQIRRFLFPAIFIIPVLMVFQAQAHDRDHDSRNRDRESRSGRDRDRDHDSRNGGEGGARVPLDGGISILLAAGIGLGMKKMNDKKNAAKIKDSDIAG
ncbi:MAG TPA: hypothetical protein VK563_00560 [Puia sp.]|nr:hypothetical protein [Puia sp.]